MGMTMTQKILAAHAGLDCVQAGQLIEANLDLVLGNDITSPVAINEFEKAGATDVFSNTQIALVMITLLQTKTLRRRNSAARCAILPISTIFRISSMWARWALNMRCSPSRALSAPGTA